MSERVVIAVDGGTASDAALDWAIDRARTVDTDLEITTVVDIDWMLEVADDPLLAEHERVLREASSKVEASGVGARCSTTLHHDRPVAGLLEASARADMLVIGSHKSRAAVGLVHGTLPLAVASRTRAPLVVVPVGWVPKAGPVVVGVDERSGSAAMEFAVAEAERTHAPLVAVRAWDLPRLAYGVTSMLGSPYDAFKSVEAEQLDAVVAPLQAQHEHLSIDAALEYGRPSVVLAERAKDARLTVVGSHGRGAVAGFILGSVGHDLLMNMPSPIVIVPQPVTTVPGEELDAPAERVAGA